MKSILKREEKIRVLVKSGVNESKGELVIIGRDRRSDGEALVTEIRFLDVSTYLEILNK